MPDLRHRQLLLDISVLVSQDLKTGIERVSRSILIQLLTSPPAGYRVEPIYYDGSVYRYARAFTTRTLEVGPTGFRDDPIDVQQNDILLTLEWNTWIVPRNKYLFKHYSDRGMKIYFIVFDLLTLLRPEFFPPDTAPYALKWMETVTEVADGLIGISRSVADELIDWIKHSPPRRAEPLRIGYFHLGADIENSLPTRGLPENAGELLQTLKSVPGFLMVGTVEPRKGHAQSLSAFEALWNEGMAVNLVIVGKKGWMMEELAERLTRHPMLGKRLFWLEGISDEYIDQIYQSSCAVIMASEGEGFGLPIIEAARHNIPLILRDLPVFREIAGPHATYFSGLEPQNLARVIALWLEQSRQGTKPSASIEIPRLSWSESASRLMEVIIKGNWYA